MTISKPDFIVVGAMKAGSSTLSFHLGNHSHIAIPQKEVHFFDRDKNYEKGTQWYSKVLSGELNASTLLIGEKTPTYCYLPKVAARIYEHYPDVKLVWIFRNPIKRAYSNYWHAYKNGFDLLSFKEAVKQEPERIKQDIRYGYLERSKYASQIQHYLSFFPKEQMYFLLFEDLIKSPIEEMDKVFDFLNIAKDGFVLKKDLKNPTLIPRWLYPLYLTRKLTGPHNVLFKVLKKILTIGVKPGYPPLSKELEDKLLDYFHASNLELQSLIEKDLSIWGK
ncbi:MAG: sulfotransferase [Chitinophagales bacterium]